MFAAKVVRVVTNSIVGSISLLLDRRPLLRLSAELLRPNHDDLVLRLAFIRWYVYLLENVANANLRSVSCEVPSQDCNQGNIRKPNPKFPACMRETFSTVPASQTLGSQTKVFLVISVSGAASVA